MIVVFGSINIDLVTRTPALPRPGETVLAASYATFCGGKGANQAVAAARASGGLLPVRMVGAVGADGFGSLARENLLREGVDVAGVVTVEDATGCAFIHVDDNAENMITVASGANRLVSAGALTTAGLSHGGVLILQMEVPFAENLAAAARARAAGARVIVNLAPVPVGLSAEMVGALADVTDLLVVNAHEAMAAARAVAEEPASAADAAAALARRCSLTVIATLGVHGALAADRDGTTLAIPSPRVAPVDTTGAGDTFVGVLGASLAEGLELRLAMERACKAAALSCLAVGAQSAMPRRNAILG
jgi:ribokinase